jgi:HAD superfamily phosphatase (TIGR01681 family)
MGRPVILQTLADDPDAIQFNMDLSLPGSPRFLTHEFNRRLVQQARQDSRLVLDVNALAGLVGQSGWSAGRYWYAAKYPFATGMIPLYADNVMRILAAQMGRSRRVLVLDLDNTMWGGIGGDDGIEGLALGNGSALGEAHSALQRMALSLKERGIILCVSSKNDEAIALDAFRNHPEMILKEDDIVAFRINWDDKAANIKAIADAIDLGLDAFVFLDDNPAERKRVRDALPSVAVPELPEDPSDWLPVFQAAGYFEQASFSKEDQLRAFLSTNVTGARGKRYDIPVAIGALASSAEIYAIGMGCAVGEIGDAWMRAIDNPIAPVAVTSAPCQEVIIKGDALRAPDGGLKTLPVPISTPGYDSAPYLHATLAINQDPETDVRNMGT